MRHSTTAQEPRTIWAIWYPLFLVSALSLYLELAVIRWIAGEIRIFSYFKNLTLLAAFLGLAIGFGMLSRRDLRRAYAPLLAMLYLLILAIRGIALKYAVVYPGGAEEVLLSVFSSVHWVSYVIFFGTLLLLFLMVMLLFVPVGQALAKEMAAHRPLAAYVVNILASLLGVWIFALTSALHAPPVLWFGLAALGMILYQARRGILSRWSLGLQAAVLAGLGLSVGSAIWSPYQKLILTERFLERPSDELPVRVGYRLDTQVGFHQAAYDLSPEFLRSTGRELLDLEALAVNYNLPYLFIRQGADILIVGAGMGNDVAAALRGGVGHIDAVEIDPSIQELGLELHPEHPYQDARVTAIVDDARSFIQRSSKTYDAIVFGLLDSHTLLTSLSSVRLDSFVYTEESFRAMREHLGENGVASVTFLSVEPWIEERLGLVLAEVFGSDGVYIYRGLLGTTYLAGAIDPSLATESGLEQWRANPSLDSSPIPTDDWPYLYLRTDRLPVVYWQALIVIGAACLAIILRSFPEVLRPDWHFWFLGSAFLLIEFKSITELALLFGTTWLVNAIAISGVLIMILLANLVVLRSRKVDLRAAFSLLILSLLLLYFAPIQTLNALDFWPRLLAGGLVLSIPLFFSGLIFGESLRRAGETAGPLASNLSGAVAGGLLEYGSLMWGIKSLYLMAMGLYLLAWLGLRLSRR